MIMPLPKALLCALGDYSAHPEESKLRQAGFATAVLHWKDLAKQTTGCSLPKCLRIPLCRPG